MAWIRRQLLVPILDFLGSGALCGFDDGFDSGFC